MVTLTILILSCLLAEAMLLVYLVVSARKFTRKMNTPYVPGSFKSNYIIEQALSLDL